MDTDITSPDLARAEAVRRLEAKRAQRGSALAYVAINALLVGVWAVTGGGAFWPIWPLLGWGIGLGAKAWNSYGRRPLRESAIQRELSLRAE